MLETTFKTENSLQKQMARLQSDKEDFKEKYEKEKNQEVNKQSELDDRMAQISAL